MNEDVNGPVPERFDPSRMYRVLLSTQHDYLGFLYVPGARHTVNGELAEAMRAKLIAANEVD